MFSLGKLCVNLHNFAFMVKIGNVEWDGFPLFLAPMEDITDPPFRSLCKKFGADMVYTEFISSEGLIRDADKSVCKLNLSDEERPVGIQIFGNNIESMKQAARLAEQANPDLIDINFGCPVKKVASKGAGAGLLNDLPKMIAMTDAVVKATRLPVTVKTRLGWNQKNKNIVEIAERLQDVGIKLITIHGRTRDQLYKGEADWTLIGEVKNNPRMIIPVIGNGDVDSPQKAMKMKNMFGVDGIMIGRAAIGNPWIFTAIKKYLLNNELLPDVDIVERIKTCKLHYIQSVEWKGERRGVFEMRKHYSGYFKGIPDFKKHKMKILSLEKPEEILKLFDDLLEATEV